MTTKPSKRYQNLSSQYYGCLVPQCLDKPSGQELDLRAHSRFPSAFARQPRQCSSSGSSPASYPPSASRSRSRPSTESLAPPPAPAPRPGTDPPRTSLPAATVCVRSICAHAAIAVEHRPDAHATMAVDDDRPMLTGMRAHRLQSVSVAFKWHLHSKLRPFCGSRETHSPGPSWTLLPLSRNSSPIVSPHSRAAATSQVAAMVRPEGNAVLVPCWLTQWSQWPHVFWPRKPCGPSLRLRGGIPRRGMAVTAPT